MINERRLILMWRELGLPFPGLFLLKQTETQGSERKEYGWGSATKALCSAQTPQLPPDQIPEAQLIALQSFNAKHHQILGQGLWGRVQKLEAWR